MVTATLAKRKVQRSFDRVANSYDNYSHVQQAVSRNLLTLLTDNCNEPSRVLDIGCGTSAVTQSLQQALPTSEVMGLDLSHHFLMRAASYFPVIQADFDSLPLQSNCIDVLFSNMALHWSINLAATLKELVGCLKADGFIVCSLPVLGTFCELKQALPDAGTFQFIDLEQLGLPFSQYYTEQIFCRYASVMQALQSIKFTGTMCLPSQHNSALSGRKIIQQLKAYYARQEEVTLTYQICYFILTANSMRHV